MMKQAVNVIAIVFFLAVSAFVALYSAMGFFDALWRGAMWFEVVFAVWLVLGGVYAVRLTWRVLR